jgi:hypothetical protein
MPVLIIPMPPIPETVSHGSKPFTIHLEILAEADGFTLNLATIALVVESAAPLTPTRVTTCGPEPVTATELVIAAGEQHRYCLEYDRRPPSPSTDFTLHIPELRRDGTSIDLPTLRFIEESTPWT